MAEVDLRDRNPIVLGRYRVTRWQGCLLLVLAIYAVVILATVWDYGITVDEFHHVEYGYSVVRWYASLFKDRWMFSRADVWLYGGFYDTISFLAIQISPLDLYDTRHLCNAAVGLLGVVAAYKLGCALGGGWTGVLAAVFLVLTPRYYGHAFNNHKDLPFAVFYLWGVYGIVRCLEPDVPWRRLLWTGVAIGCAMGVRVGGMMLVGYAGLFWGVRYVQVWLQDGLPFWRLSGRYVARVGVVFGIGYGVMLLFWPWAQTNPLVNPFRALTVFSRFPGHHVNFFEGRYVLNSEIPWYYAPKWLLLTLPEFVLLGLLAGGVLLFIRIIRNGWEGQMLRVGPPVFSALFPLAYLVFARTPLYGAARHFLFVVPPLVVLSALGIERASYWLGGRRRSGLRLVVAGLLVCSLYDMVTLHPNQYVYFNRVVAGGLPQASKYYDTDYWDNSFKLGIRWLEEVFQSPVDYKWQVASMSGSSWHLLDPDRFTVVENPWDADFYMVSALGIGHTFVPGEVLHTVGVKGVPLLYVIRPDSSYRDDPLFAGRDHPHYESDLGALYRKAGQIESAIDMFEKALKRHPHKLFSYVNLARAYVQSGRTEEAVGLFRKGLEMGTKDATVFKDLALLYIEQEQYGEAILLCEQALTTRPNYLGALRILALAYSEVGRHADALEMMQRTLRIDPYSSSDVRNLGVVLYQAGRVDWAIKVYRDLLKHEPDHPNLYFDLGTALQKRGRYAEAVDVYQEALERDPDHVEAHLNLGVTYFDQKRFDEAASVFHQAAVIDPENGAAHRRLGGQAFENLGRTEAAVSAYRRALAINPDQAGIRERLQALTGAQR